MTSRQRPLPYLGLDADAVGRAIEAYRRSNPASRRGIRFTLTRSANKATLSTDLENIRALLAAFDEIDSQQRPTTAERIGLIAQIEAQHPGTAAEAAMTYERLIREIGSNP
jgi:hypothetical protein